MKIYFLTKADSSIASSRTRAFQIAQQINTKNICTVTDLPNCTEFSNSSIGKKIKYSFLIFYTIVSSEKNSVFFLQRPIYDKYMFSAIVLGLLIRRPKCIFDFDDAIYIHSYYKVRLLIRISSAVIVGNHLLYDWAIKFKKECFLIPTSVNFGLYSRYIDAPKKQKEKLVIGWIGSGIPHYENLKLLSEPLKVLSKKYNFKLQLIGTQKYLPLINFWSQYKNYFEVEMIDNLDWNVEGIGLAYISNFDIGVMPLCDNKFNRGKSSYKAIEYMACGIPVVISPVGENRYLVSDGNNGFLAENLSEWIQKLKKLLESKELRISMGKRGQVTVRDDFSYEKNVEKIINIIESI